MVVSRAGIEVDVYLAVADGLNELGLVEVRELQHVVVEEVLLALLAFAFALDVGADIEAVFELGAGLVEEVVEAPIGHDVEVAEVSGPLHNALGPIGVAFVGVGVVEDDFNLALVVVDVDFQARKDFSPSGYFLPASV